MKYMRTTFFQRKTIFVLLCILLIGIGGGILAKLLDKQTEQKTSHTALAITLDKDPQAIVSDVLGAITTDHFDLVIPYFALEKAQVLSFLKSDKQAFTTTNGYHPTLSSENVMIIGNNAQVLVLYTIKGKKYTARYDLKREDNLWQIYKIEYNQPFTLAASYEAKKQIETWAKDIPYTTKEQTFPLPGGDTITIESTILDVSHEEKEADFIAHFNNPGVGYVIVMYDTINRLDVETILKKGMNTNSKYVYLPDDLEENGGGLLAIYPEGTTVNKNEVGILPGALLKIPILIKN
jgi:hypothetical protein